MKTGDRIPVLHAMSKEPESKNRTRTALVTKECRSTALMLLKVVFGHIHTCPGKSSREDPTRDVWRVDRSSTRRTGRRGLKEKGVNGSGSGTEGSEIRLQ